MSIDAAMDALRGRLDATICGVAWPPPGQSPSTVADIASADFAFVADGDELIATVEALRDDDVAAFVAVMGPVGIVGATVGWSEMVKLSAQSPAALEDALEAAAGATVDRLRFAHAAGADAMIIADDLASGSGWLLDPTFVEDVVMPIEHSCGRVIDGAPLLFHSDGDIATLYPALAGGCFAGVHIAAGDVVATRDAIGAAAAAGLVPLGGIPAMSLESESASAIAMRISTFRPLGLRVVCDDGGMTDLSQASALARVYALLREQV